VFIAGLVVQIVGCTSVQSADQSPIKVEDAWARRAPMAAHPAHGGMSGMSGMASTANGAVYATIRNAGSSDDVLVSATSSAADKIELHQTKNEAGVMTMRPIDKLPVPAGGTVEMKPGGYHVMLLGLKRDLNPGDSVPVTLMFQNAGPITVNAAIR
jgi:copper(I)-binding protein